MTTDFMVHNHGTVCTIEARTEAAQMFARENFAVEGWQGTPEHFSTDWRAMRNLVAQLAEEGFRVDEA